MKEKRTIELYLEVAACVRLAKMALTHANVELNRIVPCKAFHGSTRANWYFDNVISEADDRWVADYPELFEAYRSPFYGLGEHDEAAFRQALKDFYGDGLNNFQRRK